MSSWKVLQCRTFPRFLKTTPFGAIILRNWNFFHDHGCIEKSKYFWPFLGNNVGISALHKELHIFVYSRYTLFDFPSNCVSKFHLCSADCYKILISSMLQHFYGFFASVINACFYQRWLYINILFLCVPPPSSRTPRNKVTNSSSLFYHFIPIHVNLCELTPIMLYLISKTLNFFFLLVFLSLWRCKTVIFSS